jgi:hypothetical protein
MGEVAGVGRASISNSRFLPKISRPGEQGVPEPVFLEQMAKLADGGLVRHRLAAEIGRPSIWSACC